MNRSRVVESEPRSPEVIGSVVKGHKESAV